MKDWSPGHLRRSQWIVEHELAPLYALPADDLRIDDIDGLIASRRRGSANRNSLRLLRAALSAALELAIRKRVLPPDRNVARLAELPTTEKHQPQVLDAVEVRDLLAAIEGDRLRPLFVTTMALGLRLSEGFGLLWNNVDLDAGTVSIGRTSQYVDKAYHYGTGKTEESAAELALPGFVADLLREHRQDLRLQRMANRKRRRDRGIVFPNTTGGDLHGPRVNRLLSVILEQAKLPHITFRELRHTGATLLLSLGIPIDQVQELLRHTDIATTRRYARTLGPIGRDPAAAMDRFLKGGA